MKKIYLTLFFLSLLITQCNDPASIGPKPVKDPESDVNIVSPINYGNNVFYFSCDERTFAMSLSQFLSDSTIEIEAMAGDGNGANGTDKGYFVVIKRKH
jgi:hypothetical protein